MAGLVTEKSVFEAADRITKRGERVTIERVRYELGGGTPKGSPNTITPLLDRYALDLSKRLFGAAAVGASDHDLPRPVVEAARSLWATSQGMAKGVYEAKLEQGLQAARESLAAATSRADALEDALQASEGRIGLLTQDLQGHKALLQRSDRELVDVRQDLAAERDNSRRLSLDVEAARDQLLSTEQKCRAEIELANERAEAAQRRAHLEIDRERQALIKLRAEQEALQDGLSEARNQREAERHARNAADNEVRSLKAKLDEAEAESRVLALAHNTSCTRLQAELDAAVARVSVLSTQAETQDDLLQEAGKLAAQYKAEADTLRGLVEKFGPAPADKPSRTRR